MGTIAERSWVFRLPYGVVSQRLTVHTIIIRKKKKMLTLQRSLLSTVMILFTLQPSPCFRTSFTLDGTHPQQLSGQQTVVHVPMGLPPDTLFAGILHGVRRSHCSSISIEESVITFLCLRRQSKTVSPPYKSFPY